MARGVRRGGRALDPAVREGAGLHLGASPRVGVARDGRAVALNAGGQVVWLETTGRRVSRSVTSGSSFEGVPTWGVLHRGQQARMRRTSRLPHRAAGRRAARGPSRCAPSRRPRCIARPSSPRWSRTRRGRSCADAHKRSATFRTRSAPPRGRPTEHARRSSRRRIRGTTIRGRACVWSTRTGSTQRVWPIGARNPSDVELRFEAGDGVIVLEQPGGEEVRFVIDERAAASPASGKDSACAAPSWDPLEQATCRIGLVMGPAALCEGLDRR